MAMEQEREWAEAQKIGVSIDLVEAAKTHLKFLAAVDKNRFLYEDQPLQRAIYRYNAFWLPLLAKHAENPVCEGPLVVPLDCEWIWHCHRLNPVRYRFDCLKLYGRILGNQNVISSLQATSKIATEDLWSKMYPEEPFELDHNTPFSEDVVRKGYLTGKFTSYDLVSAVKRQIPFVYQMDRPHMSNDLFLEEAAARYKGFLHLIRTNTKTRSECASVPTYDVDLMWHTHQLYPALYCKDMIGLVGFLVQHDDTDSDRTKGGKLDAGHYQTNRQWEQTFGFGYWKAGAMYKGTTPTPVTHVPYPVDPEAKEFKAFENCGAKIKFSTINVVEVLLEFANVTNLPDVYKENLMVNFSKKQEDKLFRTNGSVEIFSDSKEKQVAIFQCEPKGEFLFELMSNSSATKESRKLLGSCSLSLEDLLDSQSKLSTNKWIPVDIGNVEPVLLQVFMSCTPPTPAPQVFQLGPCYSLENDMIHTLVLDAYRNMVFSLQKRNINNGAKCTLDSLEEVYCITNNGEKHGVVEFDGEHWSIKGTHGSFKLQSSSASDGSLIELVGSKMVKLFPGRRLDFELGHIKNEKSDEDFMTAVEFSAEYPYGRAVALIDSKFRTIQVTDDWIVVPSITLASMILDFTSEMVKNDCVHEHKIGVGATYGAECVFPCTRCWHPTVGVEKIAYGAECVFPCTRCWHPTVGVEKIAYGVECVFLCTRCWHPTVGVENIAYGARCGAPCIRAIENITADATMGVKKSAYGAKCVTACSAITANAK